MAVPMFLRLLRHCIFVAECRTSWTAGTRSPIKTAMMAMTTRSSINVNATRTMGVVIAELRQVLPKLIGQTL